MLKNVNHSYFKILAGLLCASFVASCTGSGVQGTSLYSMFQGFTSVEAISPTSVQLSWGLDSNYTEYRIYQNDDVTPTKKETFGTTQIKNLVAGTTYYYQISGYAAASGEKFFGGKSAIATLDRFNGLTAGGVVAKSISEVKLSWTMNSPTTKFKVYSKPLIGTWDLAAPKAIIQNGNQFTVAGLSAGQTYCFYVRAEYLDGTFEPSASTEGDINAVAKCQLMTAPMASLPSININSVTFGDFPWFWTTSGDSSYRTDIYDLATDTLVASRTGNGYFRSSISLPQTNKNFYALVSNNSGNVSRVDVNVNSNNSANTMTAIRKINSTGTKGPIYPPILSNGLGTQNLGSKVVQGDFNCDGLPDFAVSAPASVPFTTPQHYTNIGSVIVYYTYAYVEIDPGGTPIQKYGIKTDVAPSSTAVAPNPQLITYPVSSANVNLGNQLAVGNFNGDCVKRNYSVADGGPERGNCDFIYTHFNTPTADLIRATKKCDDLVIGSKGGFFYVVYGDPNIGLVSGSMSNSAGNDEQTCDAVSSTCRASKYSAPAGFGVSSFGRTIAVGDFNNDGYDDIALSANLLATSIDNILVYRGDSLGSVPYGLTNSFPVIVPDATVGLSVAANRPGVTDDFGFSLSAVPNSRLCKNNIPTNANFRPNFAVNGSNQSMQGIDATKCADLAIGAPAKPHLTGSGPTARANTGSVYICRGAQLTTGDKQRINSWGCTENYPNLINNELVSAYGYSLLGVANQNGYPVAEFNGGTGTVPGSGNTVNIWGTLFVGAPDSTILGVSTVGSVYGYYVNETTGSSTGVQAAFSAVPHTVTQDNDIACNQSNSTCGIQRLYISPGQSGMKFGRTLSTVNERAGQSDPWMPILAVGAPYRTNVNAAGDQISGAGAIYLFRGDISTFMNQVDNTKTISAPYYNPSQLGPTCSGGNIGSCTWLSGGVSPYAPTLIYDNSMSAGAHFGAAGAVGFSSLADISFNGDSQTDVITSAPDSSNPTNANGGVFAFYSNSGSFSPTVATPNLRIETNVSLEGNYQFEEAQVVGDINGDGYQDVVAHINNNSVWVLVVYYGSVNGLIQTPTPSYTATGLQPKLIRSSFDTKLGEQFFKIGDINGDGFSDLLTLSSNGLGSYIYYGSSSGLVSGVDPSISPIGKNPLRFGLPGLNAVSFSAKGSLSYGSQIPTVSQYSNLVEGVTYGKFNNDIYDDIVIRANSTASYPSPFAGNNYTGTGRVYIIYGTSTGPKMDNITGKILLQDASANPKDVVTDNPCDPLDNSSCKIQMIASPDAGALAFGFGISRRNLFSAQSSDQDGLLISDPKFNADKGIVYVYQGGLRGLDPTPIQRLLPRDLATKFGYSIVDAGDVNGDHVRDVAISSYAIAATSPRAQVVTIFFGKTIQSKSAYGGAKENTLAGTDYWNQLATPLTVADNQFALDSTLAFDYRPQVINPINSVPADEFGYGMTSVGDINQDGFDDLAINVPNGDYTLSGTVLQTGYVTIFFGSDKGLQIDTSKVTPTPYPRSYKGPNPLCDPYQVYLPGFQQNDYTHIGPNSVGDINGDGLPDIVFGASGRGHPSGKGISTGVIYVLY